MSQAETIQPISIKPHPVGNGTQRLYRFGNGYGASVVQFSLPSLESLGLSGTRSSWDGSYGSSAGLWELAVVEWKGEHFHLTYDTPIADDVTGHLDEAEIQELLDRIRALPAVPNGD